MTHLGVATAIESQTSLGLLNKRVDQIGGGLGQVNCSDPRRGGRQRERCQTKLAADGEEGKVWLDGFV